MLGKIWTAVLFFATSATHLPVLSNDFSALSLDHLTALRLEPLNDAADGAEDEGACSGRGGGGGPRGAGPNEEGVGVCGGGQWGPGGAVPDEKLAGGGGGAAGDPRGAVPDEEGVGVCRGGEGFPGLAGPLHELACGGAGLEPEAALAVALHAGGLGIEPGLDVEGGEDEVFVEVSRADGEGVVGVGGAAWPLGELLEIDGRVGWH